MHVGKGRRRKEHLSFRESEVNVEWNENERAREIGTALVLAKEESGRWCRAGESGKARERGIDHSINRTSS